MSQTITFPDICQQATDFGNCQKPVQGTIVWPMPTVAEQLRLAREAHGLTVYEVADITKIRTDHIRALEEGDYDAFAAPVYIRGFVRSYARLLRLDGQAIMEALDAELRQTEKFQEPPSLTGGKKSMLDVVMLQMSKVNWRWALPAVGVVIVGVIGVLGYRAFKDYQDRDPLENLGPGMYQAPAQVSNDRLDLPSE